MGFLDELVVICVWVVFFYVDFVVFVVCLGYKMCIIFEVDLLLFGVLEFVFV